MKVPAIVTDSLSVLRQVEHGRFWLPSVRYWQKWDNGNIAKRVDDYWTTDWNERAFRYTLGSHLRSELGANLSLLEVGCGTGLIYGTLLAQGIVSEQSYIGGDVSRNMLELARERFPGVSFMDLDALALPYKDKAWLNVICVQVIQHLPDYRRAVSELLRVTGGKLCIVSWFNNLPKDKIWFGQSEYGEMFYQNTYSLPKFMQFILQVLGDKLQWVHATSLAGKAVAVSVCKK